MRGGNVAAASGPESGPSSLRFRGFRAVDRSVVLAQVSDLLAAGASRLTPAEVLTVVCEAAATHLSLVNVVFFKRLAGQSRVLSWSAPGVSTASRMIAREQTWSRAAELVEDGLPSAGRDDSGLVVCASLWDEALALSALLRVESLRTLDRHDRALVDELLRQMLCLPGDGQA